MKGEPLPPDNGFPVRFIAPGWYGIANVKWLKRIELRETRFMGPYMAERYVTVREEPRPNGEIFWTRMSVGRSHVKSIPAKVTLKNGQYTVHGSLGRPDHAGRSAVRPRSLDSGHHRRG